MQVAKFLIFEVSINFHKYDILRIAETIASFNIS